ncbi:DUF6188 family protein [Mycobacterium sp. SMC-4]|uniref:DUF6188 family protein n=1 Tax=Mycobacterium sp. SMC-4 TaxID=2857059 RepID=UPI003CFF13EB
MALTELGINGLLVQSVLIEYTVVLRLSQGHFLVIESPFTISAHGRTTRLVPDEDAEAAFWPVRQLTAQMIDEAFADSTGSLVVCFRDGTRIEVPPDPAYEAWNVSGPGGALVVCTPGGELVTWSAGSE